MGAIENRIIRGRTLLMLYVGQGVEGRLTYTDETLLKVLHGSGYPDVALAQFHGFLNYLKEKGYVETVVREDELSRIATHEVKLAPLGVDLVEGSITDPGVVIPQY